MTLRIHFLCRRKHSLAPIEWLGNNVYFMYYPLRVTHKEFIRGGRRGCNAEKLLGKLKLGGRAEGGGGGGGLGEGVVWRVFL